MQPSRVSVCDEQARDAGIDCEPSHSRHACLSVCLTCSWQDGRVVCGWVGTVKLAEDLCPKRSPQAGRQAIVLALAPLGRPRQVPGQEERRPVAAALQELSTVQIARQSTERSPGQLTALV